MSNKLTRWISAVLLCALCAGGCGSDGSEEARRAFENSGGSALPEGHPTVAEGGDISPSDAHSAAGLAWTPPDDWESQGARSMRAATYTIRTNREGTAECAVFFFGTGQGGGVQANIDRWINQFEQPDGAPSSERARTSRAVQAGWPITRVEVAGTYTAGMGPAGASQPPEPGYKMLAAILEGPKGPVFFKLTGPAAVVDDSKDEFEQLLASIRPVG